MSPEGEFEEDGKSIIKHMEEAKRRLKADQNLVIILPASCPDIEIVDGCVILYHIPWTPGKSVQSFAKKSFIKFRVQTHWWSFVTNLSKNSMKVPERF